MTEAVIRLDQVQSPDGGLRLQPLLIEYLAWVVGQFTAIGAPIGDPSALIEKHDVLFRAELPSLIGERGRLLAAYRGDELIGIGALKPVSAEVAEVKRMCVSPALRGQGLGRAILTRLLADAGDLGYRAARLETAVFMTAARSLYRSMGFREGAPFAGSETALSDLAHLTVFMYLDRLPGPAVDGGPGSRS